MELARLMREYGHSDVVDAALGVPVGSAPAEWKAAGIARHRGGDDQYADPKGDPRLRRAIADLVRDGQGLEVDPESELTITVGATEGLVSALFALIDPGDEVVVLEPFYENFVHAVQLLGGHPRYVSLIPPHWTFDRDELDAAVSDRAKVLIMSTPCNPTGKVFSNEEVRDVMEICAQNDVVCICDEVYSAYVFAGARHCSPIDVGPRDLVVIVSSLSKSFRVTGWRLGYVIAPAAISSALFGVHTILTGGAAAPLQAAAADALSDTHAARRHLEEARLVVEQSRDEWLEALSSVGIQCIPPSGGFYAFADVRGVWPEGGTSLSEYLLRAVGLLVAPGALFFARPEEGDDFVRFAFNRPRAVLKEAAARLAAALPPSERESPAGRAGALTTRPLVRPH